MEPSRNLAARLTPAALASEAGRIARFGLVGVAATLCHLAVAFLVAFGLGAPAQLANVLGFAAAVPVSFLGHYHWSFRSRAHYGRALVRFVVVATSAFLVSAGSLAVLRELTDWGTGGRLVVSILLIPAASYVINRLLVFR